MVEISRDHPTSDPLTIDGKQVMEDVQNRHDERMTPIDQVGVSEISYPIVVASKETGKQHTIAKIAMSVNLPHNVKGTHLSRFIEVLNQNRTELQFNSIADLLDILKERLDSSRARVEAHFPYFMKSVAPVSGSESLIDYQCSYVGEANGKEVDVVLMVQVPVTSLCPCSKEISDYGAHNQRGYLTMEVRSVRDEDGNPEMVWIEDLVEVAENSASCPVYPLLKRPDERHVTMQAYENPVFVEDMVREVATKLKQDKRISWFTVHAENKESIHNHSAFARVEWSRSKSQIIELSQQD